MRNFTNKQRAKQLCLLSGYDYKKGRVIELSSAELAEQMHYRMLRKRNRKMLYILAAQCLLLLASYVLFIKQSL